MIKKCPTCGREYAKIHNYCAKCGIELEIVPNKCSGNKTALCKDYIFDSDDMYCTICGSPTTYAVDMLNELKNW